MFMPRRMSSRRWLEMSRKTSWAGAAAGAATNATQAMSVYLSLMEQPPREGIRGKGRRRLLDELVEAGHLVVETADELADPLLGGAAACVRVRFRDGVPAGPEAG